MALLNFPTSPTNGQVYTSSNGVSYQYNGTFWSAINTSYATGGFTKLDNISSGFNGSNTTFNLTASGVPVTPGTAQNLIITIGGVTQEPANAYTVSTSTITFTSAPPTGVTFSGVMLGAVMNVGVPSDSTVTSAKLDSNIAISANLSYGGTLTGSTGVLNIGSGQIYKDMSGNVGIGTSSPNANAKLSLTDATAAAVYFNSTGTGGDTAYFALQKSADGLTFGCENRGFVWKTGSATVLGGTERMRLDNSGNLGLGVTPKNSYYPLRSLEIGPSPGALFGGFASSTNLQTWVANNTYSDGVADRYAVTGSPASMFRCVNGIFDWRSTGSTTGTAGGTATLNTFMALDASGKLSLDAITLYLGGGTAPSIYRSGVNGSGIHFTTNGAIPTNETGTISDNTETWGTSAWRWSVIYAATGTINTSDRNEKQDISELTDPELAVAAKIKKLFKTFRWKDSVAKKGDEARIHVGVIAQDVWNAFEEQGLDASRYALWCEDVWYEVDGHSMDENSVPYTSESIGAIKSTRYGVRYDQLLAFVLAAL